MLKLSEAERLQLDEAVRGAEAGTSLEVIVSVLDQSGSYADVEATAAFAAAYAVLAFVLFSPIDVPPLAVLPLVAAAGIVTQLAIRRVPARWLTSEARRRRQVDAAAHAAFSAAGVHRTRARTGALVLFSLREREARLVCDSGVIDAVPADIRDAWRARLAALAPAFSAEGLVAALAQVGEQARHYLPAGEDDIDELANFAGGAS